MSLASPLRSCPTLWAGAACALAIVALTPRARAADHKQTCTYNVAHVDHTPVHVETTNGSISIRAYDGEDVQVTAKIRSKTEQRLHEAIVTVERDAKTDELRIDCAWPDKKLKDGDGCSFEVLIPNAMGVEADTSNGSITIIGLAGDLEADTSNGSITVESHDGRVKADTSNGSISVKDVTGAVEADTSNGSISVELADASPGPVDLDTSNGSVSLVVGSAFVGTIKASTTIGKVQVGPFPDGMSVEIAEKGKDSWRAIFGGVASPKSTLETSVGTVTVRARS